MKITSCLKLARREALAWKRRPGLENDEGINLQGSNMVWQINSKSVLKDRGTQGKLESQRR